MEGSPDIMAAREMAKHLGSVHHERLFTAEEACAIVPKVMLTFTAHCNTLQHAATRCNNRRHECSPSSRRPGAFASKVMMFFATHCNTLQHAATTGSVHHAGLFAVEEACTIGCPIVIGHFRKRAL